jgi:hypothetical protein
MLIPTLSTIWYEDYPARHFDICAAKPKSGKSRLRSSEIPKQDSWILGEEQRLVFNDMVIL